MADPGSPTDIETRHRLFDLKADTRFQLREIVQTAVEQELEAIQFDESYRTVAEKKFHHQVIKAHGLSAPGANILKQTCLSLGTDAGVHHGAINCTIDREPVLISATRNQQERLIQKLRPQPFGLKPLSESLTRMRQRQKHLVQSRPVQAMVILNVTPDSFSDGGDLSQPERLLEKAQSALSLGADILDVGGESTRPGAAPVSTEEERCRVIPAIQLLSSHFPQATISIDTRKASVARAALDAGATLVNDVSGLTHDPDMLSVVASAGCEVVIMHSQGDPATMQDNPQYADIVGEISAFFYQQLARAIEAGVAPEKLILDPGFGFGKTQAHNMTLMHRLPELVSIGFPLLVGTSRKSFLAAGNPALGPQDRECLTAASLAVAFQAGARLFRIHDAASQLPVLQWLKTLPISAD